MSAILVTGGAGFIGSTLVEQLVAATDDHVVTLDALTYAGRRENLAALAGHPRHTFVHGDICDGALVGRLLAEHAPRAVINVAAESHVDRSILGPEAFVQTNIVGTQVLLDALRGAPGTRFLQVSTDEVYGPTPAHERFDERAAVAPTSPYAASKAAADLLVLAYHRTYGVDVVITRGANTYGPRQLPEKLIPLMTTRALDDQPLPIYGDGRQVRSWIHVQDHARAIVCALELGAAGAVYNVDAGVERENLAVVHAILALCGKPRSLVQHVTDRPAHDARYALTSDALGALGWRPQEPFDAGLAATVAWYRAEQLGWVARVRDPAFHGFVDRWYGDRLSAIDEG